MVFVLADDTIALPYRVPIIVRKARLVRTCIFRSIRWELIFFVCEAIKPRRAFASACKHSWLGHVGKIVWEELAREVLRAVVYRAVEPVLALVLKEVVASGKCLAAEWQATRVCCCRSR